jgi:hypothetical protein
VSANGGFYMGHQHQHMQQQQKQPVQHFQQQQPQDSGGFYTRDSHSLEAALLARTLQQHGQMPDQAAPPPQQGGFGAGLAGGHLPGDSSAQAASSLFGGNPNLQPSALGGPALSVHANGAAAYSGLPGIGGQGALGGFGSPLGGFWNQHQLPKQPHTEGLSALTNAELQARLGVLGSFGSAGGVGASGLYDAPAAGGGQAAHVPVGQQQVMNTIAGPHLLFWAQV